MQRDPSGPGLKNPFTNATKPPIAGKSQMQVEILHSIFLANCAGVNFLVFDPLEKVVSEEESVEWNCQSSNIQYKASCTTKSS